jgi:hypothetical protein
VNPFQILDFKLFYSPEGDEKSTHSTPRSEARGMPFDKLKAPSEAEGLSLPAGRQGLILSGAFYPDLKIGSWRRRTYQLI